MNEIIEEYTKTIKLFGRDHEVKVLIKTEHDDMGHELIDDFDGYTKETRQKAHDDLNNGNLNCIAVIVEISCQYFVGTDSLWGNFIDCRDEIEGIIKGYTLVNHAIESYRKEATRYKEFFDGIKDRNNG
jgi:hypothetical protein